MSDPVFLLASERSGTNLLRRRLTERQSVAIGPSPLHLLKHLYFAEPYYGDLDDDRNFLTLIEDARGLAYKHFSAWDVEITSRDVLGEYRDVVGQNRSAIGIMHALYTMYARRKGYQTYFCKDNNLFDFVEEIRAELPHARFVYLHRDPRDVVLSQLGRPTQIKSVSYLAQLWRDEQIKCIRRAYDLERKGLVTRVAYESFICDEAATIEVLCEKLHLSLRDDVVNRFSAEQTDIQEWSNLNKPTMVDNYGKFQEGLSRSAIRTIEAICWWQMQWLGYSPLHEARPTVSRLQSEAGVLAAKAARVVRSKVADGSRITAGQASRARYTKALQGKWR